MPQIFVLVYRVGAACFAASDARMFHMKHCRKKLLPRETKGGKIIKQYYCVGFGCNVNVRKASGTVCAVLSVYSAVLHRTD